MISIIGEKNGVKKFVADAKTDLENMSLRSTRMGSSCFVIENESNYILKGDGTWKKISNNAFSSSSNTPDEDTDYI